MVKEPPFNVEVPNSKPVEGQTAPRRIRSARDKLIVRPEDDVTTTFDIVRRAAKKFGNKKALGSRTLLKTHVENKKVKKIIDGQEQEVNKEWTYYELSGYSFISYIDYEKQVLELGAGLRKLGLEKDDKLHLYGATSGNWLAMSHGKLLSIYLFCLSFVANIFLQVAPPSL